MCHSKRYGKISDQTFSYRLNVAVVLDENSNIFGVNQFCIPSNKGYRKTVEGFAKLKKKNRKTMSDRNTGVLSRKCGKQPGCH